MSGQTKNLFEEANRLYAAKNYDEAVSVYRKLLVETSEPNEKAKIIYNLGMAYARLKQFAEARNQFQSLLSMDADNREPGGSIMRIFRNYHHNAQVEIAKIQLETGDFEPALESFRRARTKYPFLSGCGNCIRDESYKISLFEAATLEYLNRNKEAFDIYFKIGHPRLVKIYAANGQMEKFIKLTERKNEPVIEEYMRKYSYTREKSMEFLPSRRYRDFFKAYQLGKNGNAAALMNELREMAKTRQDSYLKDWTARMLASHPRLSVPLAAAELKNLRSYAYVFYRTLGFTATPEAIEVLKTQAEKTVSWYDAESIVASLILAGEVGEAALKDLESKKLSENMKLAIQKYRSGELLSKNYEEMKFAPLRKAELPDDF